MGMQVLSYLRQTLKKRDRRDASKDNDWDFGAHQTLDITAADDAEVRQTRRRSISLDSAQKRPSPVTSETAAAGLGAVARLGTDGHGRQHSQASVPPQHVPRRSSQTLASVERTSHGHTTSAFDFPRPAHMPAGTSAGYRASASLAVHGSGSSSSSKPQPLFPLPTSGNSSPTFPEDDGVLLAAGESAKISRGLERRRRAHSMAAARLTGAANFPELSTGREDTLACAVRPKLRHASSALSTRDLQQPSAGSSSVASKIFEVQQQRLSLQQPIAGPSGARGEFARKQALLQAKRSLPQLHRIRESFQEEAEAEASAFDFPIPPQTHPVLHALPDRDPRCTGVYSESISHPSSSRPQSLLSSRSSSNLRTNRSSTSQRPALSHAHIPSTSSAISASSSLTTPTAESVSFISAVPCPPSPPRHRQSPSVASTSSMGYVRQHERTRGHFRASHQTHQTTSSTSSTTNSTTGSASSSSINAFLSSASSMTTVCDEDDECETGATSNDELSNPGLRDLASSPVVSRYSDRFRNGGRTDSGRSLHFSPEAHSPQAFSSSTLSPSKASRSSLSLSSPPPTPHSNADVRSGSVPVARGTPDLAGEVKAQLSPNYGYSGDRDSSPSPSSASFTTSSSSGTARSTPTPRTPGLSFLSVSPEPELEKVVERRRRRLALYEVEVESDTLTADSEPLKREREKLRSLVCSRTKDTRMSKSIAVIPAAIAAVDDEVTTDDENDVLAELGYYTSSTPSPTKPSTASPSTSRRSSRQLSPLPVSAHILPRSRSVSALGSKHVASASVPSVPLPSPISPSLSPSSSMRSYHRPFESTIGASMAASPPLSSRQRTTSVARMNGEREVGKRLHLDVGPSTLSVASSARQGPLTPSPISAETSKTVEWGYAL